MSIPGEFLLSREKHQTFLPHPLPPTLTANDDINRKVEEATHLLGQVKMCRTLLPDADLLIYSSLQREAIASSTIEGTIASPDELVLFQVLHRSERQAVREVANYATALQWGYKIRKLIQYQAEPALLSSPLTSPRRDIAQKRVPGDSQFLHGGSGIRQYIQKLCCQRVAVSGSGRLFREIITVILKRFGSASRKKALQQTS